MFSSGSIILTVCGGPHMGQVFTLGEHATFIVGRSNRAHLRLLPGTDKDLYVSRVHFMIEANPPLCRVMDLDSNNGTWVNGARVTTANLKHLDVIKVGHTLIRVEILEGPSAPEEPEPVGTVSLAAEPVAPRNPPGSTAEKAPAATGLCVCCQECDKCLQGQCCLECREAASQREQPVLGYLLLRELGRGGMGVVHLAARCDNATVAVKTILPAVAGDPRRMDRFLREARILQKLDHEYIVRFHEMGHTGELFFFAMDYVHGVSAKDWLQARGPFEVNVALRLVNQLLKALSYSHAEKIVHRDIKPANVLIEWLPDKKAVKVADFGLARVYQTSNMSGLTLSNELGGTLGFQAPEQITDFRGAQPPADQYAAAATLYQLLTDRDRYDFPERFEARIAKILNEEPIPIRDRRPELPEALAQVIHRALSREPEDRYPNVEAFRQALRPFVR